MVPHRTEFPKGTGLQFDVVDSTYNTTELGIHPLLSEQADPKVAMGTIAVALAVEKEVIKRSHNPWANLNVGTRPAVTADSPDVLQYDRLVASVIGRSSKDPRWAQPKPFTGVWGQNFQEQYGPDPLEKVREDLDRERNVLPATADEIAEHKKDPMKWTTDEKPPSPANKADYAGWREDPIGKYIGWDTDSRAYTPDEIYAMRKLVNSENFDRTIAALEQIDLFSDEIVLNTDFTQSVQFPANDTDTVLWEAKIGNHYYQVVTQKNPLVDRDEGHHFVVKVRYDNGRGEYREPHTPYENLQQSLEAYAIGIELERILGNETDLRLDMNANWSMGGKQEMLQQARIPEGKKIVQERTRAHLHVQEFAGEIAPAPGTFTENKPQTPEKVEDIRTKLHHKETGLAPRLLERYHGKIFTQAA